MGMTSSPLIHSVYFTYYFNSRRAKCPVKRMGTWLSPTLHMRNAQNTYTCEQKCSSAHTKRNYNPYTRNLLAPMERARKWLRIARICQLLECEAVRGPYPIQTALPSSLNSQQPQRFLSFSLPRSPKLMPRRLINSALFSPQHASPRNHPPPPSASATTKFRQAGTLF